MSELVIEGITPSAALREQLRGQRVILAFSRGKDSIAAWLAMRDAGIEVVPFYRYGIPGLQFANDSLAWFEEYFQTPILRIPHVSLWRQLRYMVFQPPQRCRVIEAAEVHEPTYRESNDLVCRHFGMDPKQAWICDGVRATDSPDRRRALKIYGPINEKERQIHIVWDWTLPMVRERIAAAGIPMPKDYQLFRRSLDGKDYRYVRPLLDEYPTDYARVARVMPLIELEFFRRERLSRTHSELPAKPGTRKVAPRADQ